MIIVLPLFSLWFGYSGATRIATIIFAAIFSIIVNVADGARSVPRDYLEVARSFRAGRLSVLREIVLPASMPYLLAGFRLAAGRALIGAVVAEFFISIGGLGYFIFYNSRTYHHNEAFVGVLLLAAFGVGFELLVAWCTRHFMPWYRRDEKTGNARSQGTASMASDPRVKAAIAHWGARFVTNGVTLTDFEEVTGSLKSYDDWCSAWSARAALHENIGREALTEGHNLTAGECLQRAGVYYHFAAFLFVNDVPQMKIAHMKAVECRKAALPYPQAAGRTAADPFRRQDAGGNSSQAARLRQAAGHGDGGRPRFNQGGRRRLRGAVSGARRGDIDFRWAGPGRGAIRFRHPRRLRSAGRARCSIMSTGGAISTPHASACGA